MKIVLGVDHRDEDIPLWSSVVIWSPQPFVRGIVTVSPWVPYSSGDTTRGISSAWDPVGHGGRTVSFLRQSRRATWVTMNVVGLGYCYLVVSSSVTKTCLLASLIPCCKGAQSQCLSAGWGQGHHQVGRSHSCIRVPLLATRVRYCTLPAPPEPAGTLCRYKAVTTAVASPESPVPPAGSGHNYTKVGECLTGEKTSGVFLFVCSEIDI